MNNFDPFNPPDPTTRYAAMSHLRQNCPVANVADSRWYAASYDSVLTGLKQVEIFVGSFIDTSVLPEDEVPVSAIPEPRHGKIRRVINGVLAPHRTMHTDEFIYELANSLLDDVERNAAAPAGSTAPTNPTPTTSQNHTTPTPTTSRSPASFDLIQQYVDPIPSTVIAHVLGVPTEDFQKFRLWSDELLENQNAQLDGEPLTLSQTHPEFAAYIQYHIDVRRHSKDPPNDLITRFIKAEIEGRLLSDDMIRTQTINLIIAGNETTRNWLGNYFTALAADPELYELIRSQPLIREKFLEESLRRDCPVQIVARAAMEETTLENQSIPMGDQVVFGIASANRDEKVFEDAAKLIPDRSNLKKHLAFGAGPHICPGASLARLEANIALNVFCDRVKTFSIQEGYEFQYNPVFWALGLRSLPITMEFAKSS